MRAWRDVISVPGWESIVDKKSTAHLSRTAALAARFDKDKETPRRVLDKIGEALADYHAIEKHRLNRIDARIKALQGLSKLATHYLVDFKADLNAAEQRAKMPQKSPTDRSHVFTAHPNVNRWDKSPETGQYMSGNPQRESLDRNVLTLARRSLRKAAYLKRIKQYYTEEFSPDPLALLDYILRPKADANGIIGLSPGVRMEATDPFHRPVELHLRNGAIVDNDNLDDEYGITGAFGQWAKTVGPDSAPFFMWLENHPICTSDDKSAIAGTRAVNYIRADQMKGLEVGKVQIVKVGGVCMAADLSNFRGLDVADTRSYMSAERKGGRGTAAYVWTTERELFIGQHSEGVFHHSSFVSGRLVRCAGMIKFVGGKVSYLSNNSGHYKPGKRHLLEFVRWLHGARAFDTNARLLCLGGQDFEGSLRDFVTQYRQI